ncbi:MAG: hypothetical protein JXA20_07440 [Spirochaetes bacterium]|nr:hypothetical protein [Spirochaetota bacterium]
MNAMRTDDRVEQLALEIQKKEKLAVEAKRKGLHAMFGNYMADVANLKVQLRKLNTGPRRVR